MTGLDRKNDADAIRGLIEAEEKQALSRFRDGQFGERLKNRIANRAVTQPRPGRIRPALRPVWVSLAVLIVLGAAAAWLFRTRNHSILGGAVAAAFLHRSPGLQAIEFPAPPLTGAWSPPASPLEKSITTVLSGAKEKSDAPSPGPSRGSSAIAPGSEPLDLKRFYEILVIDRSIERVFSDISAKTKEG
jgi:hypothetical protein